MELFYNSKIDKNTTNFTTSDEDLKHITRVMRKRKGDLIKFTNGKGYGFESQIERIEKKRIYFEIKKLNFVCLRQFPFSVKNNELISFRRISLLGCLEMR